MLERFVTLLIAVTFLMGGYWLGYHAERPDNDAVVITGTTLQSPCQGGAKILPEVQITPGTQVPDLNDGYIPDTQNDDLVFRGSNPVFGYVETPSETPTR